MEVASNMQIGASSMVNRHVYVRKSTQPAMLYLQVVVLLGQLLGRSVQRDLRCFLCERPCRVI